jgi:hypothetical protein
MGSLCLGLCVGRPALPGAVICAVLSGGTHWVSDSVGFRGGLRGVLISMDLLDEDLEASMHSGAGGVGQQGGNEGPSALAEWWQWARHYMPIRKLTDEEWEVHQAKQKDLHKRRCVHTRVWSWCRECCHTA